MDIRNADCPYRYSSDAGYGAHWRGAAAEIGGRRPHQFNQRFSEQPRHRQRFVTYNGAVGGRILCHQPGPVVVGKFSAPARLNHQYRRSGEPRGTRRDTATAPIGPTRRRRAQSVAEGNSDAAVRPWFSAGPAARARWTTSPAIALAAGIPLWRDVPSSDNRQVRAENAPRRDLGSHLNT
jgi:hypothetical protein